MKKRESLKKRKLAPRPGKGDTAHNLAKIAVGAAEGGVTLATGVPTFGSGIRMFEFFFKPPIQKRMIEFLDRIAEDIDRLNCDVNTLAKNQQFITALTHALQIAMRNHQQEKLDALRTAVLNSAVPHYIEDDMALMFLYLIDVFGTWHMRVLNHVKSGIESVYLDYKLEDERAEMYIIVNQLKDKFPGDTFDAAFMVQIFKELSDHGLAVVREVIQTDVGEMPVKADITNLGEKFLDFITTIRL